MSKKTQSFVVLMSTINGEKDSLLGQTFLPPELGKILAGLVFFYSPFIATMLLHTFTSGNKSVILGIELSFGGATLVLVCWTRTPPIALILRATFCGALPKVPIDS